MKATLEFTLPKEDAEYRAAIQGQSLKSAISDYDNRMRSILKHGLSKYTDAELSGVEKCRAELHTFLSDHNINLYD